MNGFRLLALAYALVALMIAPAWLSADEQVPPAPEPAVEEVVPAPEPAAPVAEPAPADDPAPDAEVTLADELAEPEATEQTAAADEGEPKRAKKRPVARAAADGSVSITDFEFTPATITVNEGDTVTWTNDGPTPHTATAEDGSFDTGNLDQGESGSATFTSAGTISYICTPHPFMTGKVVVRAAAAGDDDSGSTDDADDDVSAGSETSDAGTDVDGSGLPATGGETLLIALLGLAVLGAGMLLRRRAA